MNNNKETEQENNWQDCAISLPVVFIYTDSCHYVLSSNDASKEILGQAFVCQADSLKQAELEFWKHVKFMIAYHKRRSTELDRWKPFQKGKWSKNGGTWFKVFGIRVYFRYGKGMMGGWYIPFTMVNIMITNYWLIKLPKV